MKYISLNWTLALKFSIGKKKKIARLPNTYGVRLYTLYIQYIHYIYNIYYMHHTLLFQHEDSFIRVRRGCVLYTLHVAWTTFTLCALCIPQKFTL